MTRLLCLVLLLFSTAAGARMYQWQDPNSQSMQFSGVPPAWYRSPAGGPRVWVYDGGKLVDDTWIRLSPEDNRSMRETAFKILEEERQQEAIKRLERTARRADARREQEAREQARQAAASDQGQSDTSEAPPEVLPESLDPDMVTRLKAIIAEYDRTNSADIGGAGEAGTGAPSTEQKSPTY